MAKKSAALQNDTQPIISSYFSPSPHSKKRKGSDSIATHSETVTPRPHKLRRSIADETSSRTPISESPVARWRFATDSPGKPVDQPIVDKATLAAKKARREAFKQKLLGENNPFTKRSENDSSPANKPPEGDVASSDDETQPSFRKKVDTFAHAKGAKPKGSAQEVGPSGKSYTPLEKQVGVGDLKQFGCSERIDPRHSMV